MVARGTARLKKLAAGLGCADLLIDYLAGLRSAARGGVLSHWIHRAPME